MKWNLTNENLSIFIDGKSHIISRTHTNFDMILECVRNKDEAGVVDLLDVKAAVERVCCGDIELVDEETIKYKGEKINHVVVDKIFERLDLELDVKPLMHFLDKLMANPSKNSLEQAWTFIEAHNFTIDDEGFCYLYKGVNPDFTDWYTGTVMNPVGSVIKMPRNQVDDNFEQACSCGYHLGTFSYAESYAIRADGHLLLAKLDPKNIVSVPREGKGEKLRVCEYKIVEEIKFKK